MATKKKAVEEKPVEKVNFWQLACEVEDVSIKLERVKSLLSIIAESKFELQTELLWLGVDLLEFETIRLDEISNKIMDVHRETTK